MNGTRWKYATFALVGALILAVVSPAVGGPSLKRLVKKEVAKQISKATGPPGANGTNGVNGVNGVNGLPGTARAYARVDEHATNACSPQCVVTRSRGISSVTHPETGQYCVNAPGIRNQDVPAVATVDFSHTADPQGNASAQIRGSGSGCTGDEFAVRTERIDPTDAISDPADDVGFMIVIP